jgi:hypothetical protein
MLKTSDNGVENEILHLYHWKNEYKWNSSFIILKYGISVNTEE